MTPTAIGTGETLTSTTTESAWVPKGGYNGLATMTLTWVSGSFQYAIAPRGTSPIINSNHTSITSADTKIIFSFNPGIEELRVIGTATIHVTVA